MKKRELEYGGFILWRSNSDVEKDISDNFHVIFKCKFNLSPSAKLKQIIKIYGVEMIHKLFSYILSNNAKKSNDIVTIFIVLIQKPIYENRISFWGNHQKNVNIAVYDFKHKIRKE